MAETTDLTAQAVVDALTKLNVSHVVWLPDTEAGFLYHALRAESRLTLVPVAREGECVAIAAGLLVGGKSPIVIMQSTGFFESGDSTRGMAIDFKLPLTIVIGYRGYERDRPMADSAGAFLEPILKAWGLPYYVVESDADLGLLERACSQAHERLGPVAVLIGKEYA